MHYLIILQILLTLATVKSNHTTLNQTEFKDVIVTYSHHAETEKQFDKPKPKEDKAESILDKIIMVPENMFAKKASVEKDTNDRNEAKESNEVVFIPNQREVVRNGDYSNNPRIDDVMDGNIRTVNDVMKRQPTKTDTESPVASDVIFFTGKNSEKNSQEEEQDREIHDDTRRSGIKTTTVVPKLDCKNLDCENRVDSMCGAKLERKTWKYRLFLNECFFRKVNCYFQNEENRYRLVPLDKCHNAGVHSRRDPNPQYQFPIHYRPMEKPFKVVNTRRNFPSRRSLSLSVDGHACQHSCPASCQEDYAPECAVSGQTRKVFLNHCKLDYNSCVNNIVWHSRPLSECVGGRRADAQQNRAFIDWMQRVGIIDKKGKLVLS